MECRQILRRQLDLQRGLVFSARWLWHWLCLWEDNFIDGPERIESEGVWLGGGDAIQHAFDVRVNRPVPFVNLEALQRRVRHQTRLPAIVIRDFPAERAPAKT